MKIDETSQIEHIMFPISIEFKEKIAKYAQEHDRSVSDLIKSLLSKEIGYEYKSSNSKRSSKTEEEKKQSSKDYHKNRNELLKLLRNKNRTS